MDILRRKSDGIMVGCTCRVSEVFTSIQGEGPFLGAPAVFVRLSTCNLRCPWCDTKYAWQRGRIEPIGRLLEKIDSMLSSVPAWLVVVTGGEPLLQQDCVVNICLFAQRRDVLCSIETNGVIGPSPRLLTVVDHVVVSPKLSNSFWGGLGSPEKAAVNREWFRVYHSNSMGVKVYWKFVVASPKDLEEVDDFVETHHIQPKDVFLMPLSTTVEEQLRLLPLLVGHALRRGYRVTPRLHILASVR